MKELIEAIEQASNVESIKFNKSEDRWEISYYKYGKVDSIKSEDLIDFLYNA